MAVCLLMLLLACGDPSESTGAGPEPRANETQKPSGRSGEYRATGTVLQTADNKPQLCLGGVMDSLPPQCSGIPIRDWDWDAVDDEEVASDTRWGTYEVTGAYDGTTFTLTGPVGPPDYREEKRDPITTPCPEPNGGWEPGGGQEDVQEAARIARREPDFAGLWVDHIGEAQETEFSPVILNVAFTGDLDRHEADLRTAWDGPLCVVEYERTLDELLRIQSELQRVTEELGLEMLWSDAGEYTNHVELGVVFIDEATQAEIVRRYGPGTVRVTAALQPI
jgi:hypothetical protein